MIYNAKIVFLAVNASLRLLNNVIIYVIPAYHKWSINVYW